MNAGSKYLAGIPLRKGDIPDKVLLVERAVTDHFGVDISQVRSASRARYLVDPRHAIWYILKKRMDMPCTHIAWYYHRDHTTVLDGIERVKRMTWLETTAALIFNKLGR